MRNQLEKIAHLIEALEKDSEAIDAEDLEAMYNLRDYIKREREPIDNELFVFAVDPLIRRYNLNVEIEDFRN